LPSGSRASALLAAGRQIVAKLAPDAGLDLDVRLRELAEFGARLMLRHAKRAPSRSREEAPAFDAVIDLWDDHAGEPVSSLRQYVSQDDLEDLLVIGYEFWLALRDTAYLQSLLDEGCDFIFDKYGDYTLRELLDELGITRDYLVQDALRFGPPVIQVVRENGMLAAFLRRRLEPFFLSEDALALLG
jgi:hypothetical protein